MIKGIVVDKNNIPIRNAVIVIEEINDCKGSKKCIYAVTNKCGEYAVVVPYKKDIDYLIEVYEPPIIGRC